MSWARLRPAFWMGFSEADLQQTMEANRRSRPIADVRQMLEVVVTGAVQSVQKTAFVLVETGRFGTFKNRSLN